MKRPVRHDDKVAALEEWAEGSDKFTVKRLEVA
jgi:hypothetical protein